MKFNLKTISLGSLAALALLAAPISFMHSAHAEGGPRGRGHHLEQLNLTEEQSTQIEAIRTDTRSQMQSVLTAEQQTTLENSENRGRRAFRQLDLSEDQREQLRAIRESSREQMGEVLTQEQREQLEEMHEQRGSRRGEGRPERAGN